MTVVLFNKQTETYETIHSVTKFEREAVAIGFSETKFRYEWHLRLKNSVVGKSFPCNKYEIHLIRE